MGAVTEVTVGIYDFQGRHVGDLSIFLLPSDKQISPAPILELRGDWDTSLEAQEPIQLLEAHEYRYVVSLSGAESAQISLERTEVFVPDTHHGDRGRLRTGFYTGTLQSAVLADGQPVGTVSFEVRSLKLDYMKHYRWMLEDISEEFTEVLMQGFAPTETKFRIDESRDAATLYQRFTFLKSLITGDSFEAALHQIVGYPHREWVTVEQERKTGEGVPRGTALSRQLTRPGPRVPWGEGVPDIIGSLPLTVTVRRAEETVDTVPNRFIKYVLQHWRDLVVSIQETLRNRPASSYVHRGLRESEELIGYLDSWLSRSLFAQVGRLQQFPIANQVLQKREGYRHILQAYIESELAARLSWDGGEDVYGAGQRDVATLYEFWVFLQLARIISAITGQGFNLVELLEAKDNGLNIGLRRGEQRAVSGSIERFGRRLHLELWYNLTFGTSKAYTGSWTRAMRPDCSLRITHSGYSADELDETWIHFDAKYRVEDLTGFLRTDNSDAEGVGEDDSSYAVTRSKRADILKMHAYRDAIRRSSGAYVIYPGILHEHREMYHEILPGLGAFALRPSDFGEPSGAGVLGRFIDDVLSHAASQITEHERERFWVKEVHSSYRADVYSPYASFLEKPPDDTRVLLGKIESEAQWAWIHKLLRYNVQISTGPTSTGLAGALADAEVVVLFGADKEYAEVFKRVGNPQLLTEVELQSLGCPDPSEGLHLCFTVTSCRPTGGNQRIKGEVVDRVYRDKRTAVGIAGVAVVSWRDVMLAMEK